MKKVAILGSTGSIGKSTLEVIEQHRDRFEVVALAAGTNVKEMVQQIEKYCPKVVSMSTKEAACKIASLIDNDILVLHGERGVFEVATHDTVTHVVSAIVGIRGLIPTMAACEAGKIVLLANKESLVVAGHLFRKKMNDDSSKLIPVDSEHSAIFQCLNGERRDGVSRLILTASGGALRHRDRESLREVTVEEALSHPKWSMGKKITIDSATMMNKGLEVIEAHWLFDIPYDRIEVLVHPQSIVHSMVEFDDGAIMAQLGSPDMKVPIAYALAYPERLTLPTERVDFTSQSRLEFEKPDLHRYPFLQVAYEVGREGGTMPTVLNSANEVAVDCFLNNQCSFAAIEKIVYHCLELHQVTANPALGEILEVDQWARQTAHEYASTCD